MGFPDGLAETSSHVRSDTVPTPAEPTAERVDLFELRRRAPQQWIRRQRPIFSRLILSGSGVRTATRPLEHDPQPRRFLHALTLGAGLGLAALVTLPFGWREQAMFGSVLIFLAVLVDRMFRSPTVTLTLMAMSVFSTLRYGYWRTTQTWEGITSAGHLQQWDVVFVLLLLGAEFYAIVTLVLGYFQTLGPLGRQPVPLKGSSQNWPTVDILIPTYNEPLSVVRATILSALAMDYPANKMNVFVLDDGCREEFRQFAAKVGAGYMTRDGRAHAKAGNINHALARTSADFVAIFDSDHVPTRSFLQMTVGWFERDPKLGLVQTPHHFYSPDPIERNLGQFRKIPNESELFHRLIQDGNDLWNASYFCGSCAVMRRKALDEIGGIAVETVTEDAHTALRMQRRRWNTAYVNVPQAAGLATETLAAHIGQRIRWARGMVQILRLENPLFGPGLSLPQRLCYFNAAAHFLFALPRLVFLTVPLVYLLLGMVNIYGYSLAVFAYAMPHLVLAHVANARVQGRYRFSFWSEIYETLLAPYVLAPSLLALINPRFGKFNVTTKGRVIDHSFFDRNLALPFLFLLALNVAGLLVAGHRWATDPAHRDTVVMNAAWTLYNVVILSVAASVALEKQQRRSEVRVDVPVPLTLITTDGHRLTGTADELSRGGAAVRLDRLDRPVQLQERASIVAAFEYQGDCCEIVARVAQSSGSTLHLTFGELELWQEEYLLAVMYSRPEAWLLWHERRPLDRPLRSLLHIVLLGMRGLVFVVIGALTPAPVVRYGAEQLTKKRKPAPVVAALVFLIVVLTPVSLGAADQPGGGGTGGSRSTNFQEAYDLSAITDGPGDIRLEGLGASTNLFFDVPLTKIISAATLGLRYASPTLGSNAVTLELWLNGTRAESLRLTPGDDVRAEIALPTDLLNTSNTLTLRLGGSCRACAQNRLPWILIDLRSTLVISGSRLPLPNDLSQLPIPFLDPTGQRSWVLPVVFSDRPDATTLQAAAVVASWLGVFSDVRGVRFPVTVGDVPEGNALVLAAGRSELGTQLSIPSPSGPLVAVRDNPRDPYGKLLIVAGDGPSQLLAAARALVTAQRLPQRASVIASRDVLVPAPQKTLAPRWLATDKPAAIGTYTSAERLKVRGSGSVNIYFRLQPDLFLPARPSVPLLLKYGYAGALPGADAAVHIRLNGQDIDTIRVRPSSGYIERADVVRLPTGRFRPYANTLTVDFDFGRHNSEPTEIAQYAAILRDSSIDLRGIPHSVVLPRLELFADAGFPFTARPDLGRTAVVLSNRPTRSEYEVLLDSAGFFGAQTGSPATFIGVTDAAHIDTERDKDLVVLGAPSSQPLLSEWTASLPLQLSGGLRVNPQQTRSRWLHPEWPFRDGDRDKLAALIAARPQLGVIVEQFVSPFRPDRSIVAIVPGDGSTYAAIPEMFLPAVRRGPIYGGVALAQSGQFQSFLVGGLAYHSGDRGLYQRAVVFLFENYRILPLVVVLLSVAIAYRARREIERVAARRLATARMDITGG